MVHGPWCMSAPLMIISIIAAMAANRVIGRNNQLPWHLPGDLPRLKRLTIGHAIILGRKTFESIGRVLPDRENIVLSRRPGFRVNGATVLDSLDEAILHCRMNDQEEIFVLGGAQVYEAAMPMAERLYLTLIHRSFEGDAFFPTYPEEAFVEKARDNFDDPISYSFVVLQRI